MTFSIYKFQNFDLKSHISTWLIISNIIIIFFGHTISSAMAEHV